MLSGASPGSGADRGTAVAVAAITTNIAINAVAVKGELLALPIRPDLDDPERDHVVAAVRDFFG